MSLASDLTVISYGCVGVKLVRMQIIWQVCENKISGEILPRSRTR